MKRGLLILVILIVTMLSSCKDKTPDDIPEELFCNNNEDCVPSSCCHPDSCVNVKNAPDCTGIKCTLNCEPGTLDCQQGSCVCENNKCAAKIK